VHLEVRLLSDERARGAGVIEVDVAEQEMADVCQRETALRQSLLERSDVGRRAAVEKRGPVVRLEQIAANDPLGAEVVKVD